MLYVVNNLGRGVPPHLRFALTLQGLRQDALALLVRCQQRAMMDDQLVSVLLQLQERQLTDQLFLSAQLRSLVNEKSEVLREQLKADVPAIRLVAVLTIGRRHLHLEVDLIECLKDPKSAVRVAAHRGSGAHRRGTDFGPAPDATAQQRDAAMQRWYDWWTQQDAPPRPPGLP